MGNLEDRSEMNIGMNTIPAVEAMDVPLPMNVLEKRKHMAKEGKDTSTIKIII